MKATDLQRERVKSLFDVVSSIVIMVSDQFVARKGSQIFARIDQKLDDLVRGGTMDKHRRGVGPPASVDVQLQQEL